MRELKKKRKVCDSQAREARREASRWKEAAETQQVPRAGERQGKE